MALLFGVCAIAVCAVATHGVSGLWLDVPYIHQERDGCGAASLAMVLRYWQTKNVAITEDRSDPAKIQRALYAAKPRGIYASDMERYLRESGFEVFAFRGDWNDLRSHIAKGRPLIAGLKPSGKPAHYVVVVGIDSGDAVLVNDPERGSMLRMERGAFEKVWKGTGNWTLLGVPRASK